MSLGRQIGQISVIISLPTNWQTHNISCLVILFLRKVPERKEPIIKHYYIIGINRLNFDNRNPRVREILCNIWIESVFVFGFRVFYFTLNVSVIHIVTSFLRSPSMKSVFILHSSSIISCPWKKKQYFNLFK